MKHQSDGNCSQDQQNQHEQDEAAAHKKFIKISHSKSSSLPKPKHPPKTKHQSQRKKNKMSNNKSMVTSLMEQLDEDEYRVLSSSLSTQQ